jgi:hypothetical protein
MSFGGNGLGTAGTAFGLHIAAAAATDLTLSATTLALSCTTAGSWSMGFGAGSTITANGKLIITTMDDAAGTYPMRFNTATGAVTYTSSSRETKNSIEDCPYGLTEIMKVKPRRFKRNGDGDRWFVGMVADEISSIIPELVPMMQRRHVIGEGDDTTIIPGGVDYPEYTAVLTNAIKEIVTRIVKIERKIAA